MVDDKVVTLL